MEASHRGTRPLLAQAAYSIAHSMAFAQPVEQVLRARVFQPYAEALRQYIVLRLGQIDSAVAVLSDVRERVEQAHPDELFAPPGARARLYRWARERVEVKWGEQETAAAEDLYLIPWRSPVRGAGPEYVTALERVRGGLPSGVGELLELRYARELSETEIAFVLNTSVETVEVQLELARAQARHLVGGLWSDPSADVEPLLLEAFALEPGVLELSRQSWAELAVLAPGTVLGGRYEIDAQVGTGGMGNVYRAKDTEVPGHVVALKLLHQPALTEEARAASLRELHLIASVFHPSVVQFKDHGWHANRLWFVMTWYEGETLESRIRREPLRRAEAQEIFQQLALALATIHSSGIRHQDIKPENIFLAHIQGVGNHGGRQVLPVLLDLGVAAKEAELILAGTPVYFAPEVAAQYARVAELQAVSPRADVFSLCLSLRNALEPSSRDDVPAGAVERFIQHRAAHAPAPPLSPELRYLRGSFERWLNVDPQVRPSAEELAQELAVLTAPERARERRLRLLRLLGPLLLALVAVFSSVVYGLNRKAEVQKLEAARARVEASLARGEAQRARLEVADMQEDLTAAAAREKALEEEAERTRKRYRSSQFTREQLANKLARVESQHRLLKQDYDQEKMLTQSLGQDLQRAQERHAEAMTNIGLLREELEQQQDRSADLTRRAGELTSLLGDTRGQLSLAEQQVGELRTKLDQSQTRLDTSEANSRALKQRVLTLESELERTQRRLSVLERASPRVVGPRPGRTRPLPPRPASVSGGPQENSTIEPSPYVDDAANP